MEIEKTIMELLVEMDDMPPEAIEEFRSEWIAHLKEMCLQGIESLANAICDVAVDRAKRNRNIA